MGGSLSSEECQSLAANLFQQLPTNYADVGIDQSLLMFSGVDSLARLHGLSSNLQWQVQGNLPAYVEKVGGVLQGFTPVPNAVGLGAFVIATFLEVVFNSVMGSSGSNRPSPMDMLRSVFAEEKSSEVWNQMDEYMKRYKMYLRDDHCLLEETQGLEKRLSLQLTRLRNSILVDGQMSSRAVKHWVNGAAFHAQMLIHVVRLRQRTGAGSQKIENAKWAVNSALDTYYDDAVKILEKYKTFKKSKFRMRHDVALGCTACVPFSTFHESEINFSIRVLGYKYAEVDTDIYIDYIFRNLNQPREIKFYFSQLKNNLHILLNQNGNFQIV